MNPFPESIPAHQILTAIRAGGRSPLGPGHTRSGDWRGTLESLSDQELLGVPRLGDRDAAACVRAGLLLFADDLDASHTVCQSVPTAEGSYWHAIMHRREPDYSNSKYWFRRVGSHPVFERLQDRLAGESPALAEILGAGPWEPFRVVDLVASCVREGRAELQGPLEELQEREMLELLTFCYRQAV